MTSRQARHDEPLPFEDADQKVRESLQKEGFGVLTEIDDLEAGITLKELASSIASHANCTQVYVSVIYTPP